MLLTVHSSEHLLAVSRWPSKHQVHCGWGGRTREKEDKESLLMVLLSAIRNTAITRQLPTMQQWQLEAGITHTHLHTHNTHINVLCRHTNPETHTMSVSIIFTGVHLKSSQFNSDVRFFCKSPDILWPQAPLQRLLSVSSVMCF